MLGNGGISGISDRDVERHLERSADIPRRGPQTFLAEESTSRGKSRQLVWAADIAERCPATYVGRAGSTCSPSTRKARQVPTCVGTMIIAGQRLLPANSAFPEISKRARPCARAVCELAECAAQLSWWTANDQHVVSCLVQRDVTEEGVWNDIRIRCAGSCRGTRSRRWGDRGATC